MQASHYYCSRNRARIADAYPKYIHTAGKRLVADTNYCRPARHNRIFRADKNAATAHIVQFELHIRWCIDCQLHQTSVYIEYDRATVFR